MKQINIGQAKADFSRLVEEAAAGEEIVIAKRGKPVARLVALERRKMPREPGAMEGEFWIKDSFDDPLPPDLQKYFE